MKVGLFISFDFTIGGMIFTEARNYNNLFDKSYVKEIVVFGFDSNVEKICKEFKFPYKLVKINSCNDAHLFEQVDVLFTWQWHQEFDKLKISRKQIDVYKILSYFTLDLHRKIYFRICDTRHFMRDYKFMIREARKNQFIIEENGSKIFALDKTSFIDYSKCYYICNGSREIKDWCHKSLTFSMPFLTSEMIQPNTIYLSDDILFCYSELYNELSYLENIEKSDKLYHVGNLNPQKVERFKELLAKPKNDIVLRLSNKEVLNKELREYKVELRIPGLYGIPMYEELSQHNAYVFIGNGDADTSYINKTLYDASIARTVFLIYKRVDCFNQLEELSDYYFDNATELAFKAKWIKKNYSVHLEKQRNFLLKKLSTEKFEYEKTGNISI